MIDLNQKFLDNMKMLLEDEYNDFIASYGENYYNGVRLNKITENELKCFINERLNNVPWCDKGYYYEKSDELSKSVLHQAGAVYLQEPSAMSPASVLPIQEGDYVLDLCASPGGKSTQLATRLNKTGFLVANDLSNKRARVLARNIEKAGVNNYIVINESHEKMDKVFTTFFDKILVDAPCSGEGMFRKDKDVREHWTENSPKEYATIQKDILQSAGRMVKTGGYIVYSTCTFNRQENEDVIEEFLINNDNFELVPIENEYFYNLQSQYMKNAYRIFPHKEKGEGHFLALIKCIENEDNKSKQYFYEKNKISKAVYEKIINHFKNILTFDLSEYLEKNNMTLYQHGTSIFIISKSLPKAIDKLRIVRSGLLLCDIEQKGRKEIITVSSILPYAFEPKDFKNVVYFNKDDDRLQKFFKGETVFLDEEKVSDGFLCIAYKGEFDSFNIGYGQNQSGKIKNKYNKLWLNT